MSYLTIIAAAMIAMTAAARADVRIVMEEIMVPSSDAGIEIYVRNKRLAEMRSFRPERTLLYVHGATYPASTAFDLKLDGQSWMDYIASRGYDVYLLDLRTGSLEKVEENPRDGMHANAVVEGRARPRVTRQVDRRVPVHERQRRVVEREGRGPSHRARHVGDAIMDHAVHFVDRVVVGGGARREARVPPRAAAQGRGPARRRFRPGSAPAWTRRCVPSSARLPWPGAAGATTGSARRTGCT